MLLLIRMIGHKGPLRRPLRNLVHQIDCLQASEKPTEKFTKKPTDINQANQQAREKQDT